jgi:glycosyltransferase involved in cell wall biosynthesis
VSSVALISEHASPLAAIGDVDAGGQNIYVRFLARALAALGHDVRVLTRRDDPSLPARVPMAPGVVVEHIDAGPPQPIDKDAMFAFMDEFAASTVARLGRAPVDVVHSHFWMSGWVGMAVREALGMPLVHTFHALGSVKRRCQGPSDTSPFERDDVERRLVRDADRIIATCSDEMSELTALGARPDRVAVIPAGFDAETFHPRPDGRWFQTARYDGPVRLVAVSRLVARKGLADVIEALSRLEECTLVIAGGPPAAELADDRHHLELRELAGEHGVLDRVRFTGGISPSAVAAIHHESDLFVAAPWYEPFGIAPVEAMGCGLPVVGTAVGGLLDTVIDGGTGTLVPPRNSGALAAAIAELARQPELRYELGARASWRAHRRFTWPVVARAIADEYRLVRHQHAARHHPGARGRGA